MITTQHDIASGTSIQLSGKNLVSSDKVDIMEIKFDSSLTMKSHVFNLASKTGKKLTALRSISTFLLDSNGCKTLYKVQVHSYLEYAPLPLLDDPPRPPYLSEFYLPEGPKQKTEPCVNSASRYHFPIRRFSTLRIIYFKIRRCGRRTG